MFMSPAMPQFEFTINRYPKPFTYALALDQIGQDAVDARIGVEPSGEASRDQRRRGDEDTEEPEINAGAIAAVSLVPGAHTDERFAASASSTRRLLDARSTSIRRIRLGEEIRQPQPSHRVHAAELRCARW